MRRIRSSKICPILSAKLSSQALEVLPVIVQSNNNDFNLLNSLIQNMSGKIKNDLPLIGGISCNLSTEAIYRLAEDPNIEYISFDSQVFALMDIGTATIGGNLPHDKNYLGEGITVAVIDTGVSPHNDLTKPNDRIVGFKDLVNNKTSPYDDNGHGTHVAGIVGSNGYSSRGKYAGVAPKANILAVKALDENGSGSTSNIVKAISWVIETKSQYNTKVINLSLGSPANNPCSKDPLCKAVSKAVNSGIVVVVAAGNSGPLASSILSPGINPDVITVGAVDDKRTIDTSDDTIASFSSRGPTIDGLTKPDLVSPGVNIMSLSNKKADDYVSLSGTSMATPFVSGSVALMLEKDKNLSPKEVKRKLLDSCTDMKESKESQGVGMINLEKLFKDVPSGEKGKNELNQDISQFFNSPIVETFLVLLFVMLLLENN
ncbi:S8 family peptidase [Anaerosalibacter sp. Marseille-P3206]|uniref:S8 family peptidase n=1 Tax=Anaerosalibacter sp. Marseille-P3206 TaxID=1871005 RepID=UPI000985A1CE|nr:S8 family peptidase [Anaerosalibacter sp. Marseille-P3206]